jgi:NAD+ kinase
MIVGIRGTVRAEGIRQVLPTLCNLLNDRGLQFRLSEELLKRGRLSLEDCGEGSAGRTLPENQLHYEVDVILTLGGDGSMLAALNDLTIDRPILGVHMGTRGYLTATIPDRLPSCLDRLAKDDLLKDHRMMIHVETLGQGPPFHADALNDVVVASAQPGRVIRLKTRINGEELFNLVGDGLIHATPTGSTAYNLGGEGPCWILPWKPFS